MTLLKAGAMGKEANSDGSGWTGAALTLLVGAPRDLAPDAGPAGRAGRLGPSRPLASRDSRDRGTARIARSRPRRSRSRPPLAAVPAFERTLVFAFKIGVIIRARRFVDPRGQQFQVEQILSGGRGRHPFSLTPSEREVNCGNGLRPGASA